MTWGEFAVVLGVCMCTMFACRVMPLFALKGRELPESLAKALKLIPPATFAALVANDVLDPGMFVDGIWPAAAILVASVCVMAIAVKTRSLLWSAIGGVVSYAILLAI